MQNDTITLEDIEQMPKEMLNAEDIAPYLGCDPQHIREQAQEDPIKLGFPVMVTKSRVKIPKRGFVHFMRYGHTLALEGTT